MNNRQWEWNYIKDQAKLGIFPHFFTQRGRKCMRFLRPRDHQSRRAGNLVYQGVKIPRYQLID